MDRPFNGLIDEVSSSRRRSLRGLNCIASCSPKNFLAAGNFSRETAPFKILEKNDGDTGADDALDWILDA